MIHLYFELLAYCCHHLHVIQDQPVDCHLLCYLEYPLLHYLSIFLNQIPLPYLPMQKHYLFLHYRCPKTRHRIHLQQCLVKTLKLVHQYAYDAKSKS